MTKRSIEAIIKESNQNKDIKWRIIENTKKQIVLSNDYDKNIRYEISLNAGEEGRDISATDESHCGISSGVCYLLHGNESYADFTDMDKGVKKAIESVVRHFYYYY